MIVSILLGIAASRERTDEEVDPDFPAHWVDNAVHYGELKKCLKRIVGQLHAIGLKPEVLHELLERDRLRYTLGSMIPVVNPYVCITDKLHR